MKAQFALMMALTMGVGVVSAFGQHDAEGCQDSALVTRFPGSEIRTCEDKEFNSADMSMPNGATKTLEGEYHNWDYAAREGTSAVQVLRNFQNALRQAGFTIDFIDASHITAHKANAWVSLEFPGDHYYQTIILTKQMQQEVAANADSLAEEIEKSGHVAVYGINFDTGKATLRPDSEKVLQEIDKLLAGHTEWRMRVEGHTDNTGSAASNMTLSNQRAQAVVAWLTAHGIAPNRLTAQGFGQSKPVADNGSEDGRAKNRRVELARQ